MLNVPYDISEIMNRLSARQCVNNGEGGQEERLESLATSELGRLREHYGHPVIWGKGDLGEGK